VSQGFLGTVRDYRRMRMKIVYYFDKEIGINEFADLQFVISAIGTFGFPDWHCIIYVMEDYIICTDGIRLHRIGKCIELEAGQYRLISANKSTIIIEKQKEKTTYPNFDKLINSCLSCETAKSTSHINTIEGGSNGQFLYELYKTADMPFSPKYIKDLGDYEYTINADPKAERHAWFVGPNRIAIVCGKLK
jgi:hypothetical protein